MEALFYPKDVLNQVLVFDVETTALLNNLSEDRYITQISFMIYDISKMKITKIYNNYINIPQEVVITEFIQKLTGVNRELLNTKGISIVKALRDLYYYMQTVDYIVAHNLNFDKGYIELEVERNKNKLPKYMSDNYFKNTKLFNDETNEYVDITYNLRNKKRKQKLYCTLFEGINMCKLPMLSKNKKIIPNIKKFPKLTELYYTLFRINPDEKFMHNSLIDVLFTLRCFIRMRIHREWSNEYFDKQLHKMLTL